MENPYSTLQCESLNTETYILFQLTCIPFIWRLGPPDCQFDDDDCENVDKAGDDHERG